MSLSWVLHRIGNGRYARYLTSEVAAEFVGVRAVMFERRLELNNWRMIPANWSLGNRNQITPLFGRLLREMLIAPSANGQV